MKKDIQEDWKVEQHEHQMHANQKWVICPCVLFILTPHPDARRIKTPIYLLTLPIVFLSFGCFADNSHAGQRGCSYHLLCRCLCLLQCNLPSLYPVHNTPVQTCRIFWQFLTICEHMLGWPVKSANLRVENVQHCRMFFFLFSCYHQYHVVCTACDPIPGLSSCASVFQALLMVRSEFVIWLPCTTSMAVQTVHQQCRKSSTWSLKVPHGVQNWHFWTFSYLRMYLGYMLEILHTSKQHWNEQSGAKSAVLSKLAKK